MILLEFFTLVKGQRPTAIDSVLTGHFRGLTLPSSFQTKTSRKLETTVEIQSPQKGNHGAIGSLRVDLSEDGASVHSRTAVSGALCKTDFRSDHGDYDVTLKQTAVPRAVL